MSFNQIAAPALQGRDLHRTISPFEFQILQRKRGLEPVSTGRLIAFLRHAKIEDDVGERLVSLVCGHVTLSSTPKRLSLFRRRATIRKIDTCFEDAF